MSRNLQLVDKTADEALYHYMQKHNIMLPQNYWQTMLQTLAQGIMEIEVAQILDASLYERNQSRRAYRNGYRNSVWQTQYGDIDIRIPKLRSGTYYPVSLDANEQVLSKFVIKAFLQQTRYEDVENLLAKLSIDALNYQVAEFHEALHDAVISYSRLKISGDKTQFDLMPFTVRGHKRYLAIAISDDKILAYETTTHADEAFWREFVRRLNLTSAQGITYKTIGQLRHIIQLNIKPTQTQMCLVA